MCRNMLGKVQIQFNILTEDLNQFLVAEIKDFGRGIYNIEAIMAQEVPANFKKGSGIPNSKKLVNYFTIDTGPDKGTLVTLKNLIPSKKFVTISFIKGWNDFFFHNADISAYEELKYQNMELVDLTEALHMKNQETESQLYEIQRLNKELDQFAYVTSHDLKAPLKNIEGLLDFLEDSLKENDIDQARLDCEMMKGQTAAMDKLIGDILSYSKIGKQNIQKGKVDMTELVNAVLTTLPIPEKFSFVIEYLPVLFTEEVFLFQIFSNLIINAIKHHHLEDGIITLGSVVHDHELQFYVKDNGPGICEESMHKIFELFESMTAAKDNSGIGLSIVKSIIKIKKTRVWVESDGKTGSTFHFTWPKEEMIQIQS